MEHEIHAAVDSSLQSFFLPPTPNPTPPVCVQLSYIDREITVA